MHWRPYSYLWCLQLWHLNYWFVVHPSSRKTDLQNEFGYNSYLLIYIANSKVYHVSSTWVSNYDVYMDSLACNNRLWHFIWAIARAWNQQDLSLSTRHYVAITKELSCQCVVLQLYKLAHPLLLGNGMLATATVLLQLWLESYYFHAFVLAQTNCYIV